MKIKEIIFSISLILFLATNIVFAQDNDDGPKKVRLKLEYLKLKDGTKVLSSNLYWKKGKNINPVVDQEVSFFAEGDTSELDLGIVKSDKEGYAVLHIENGFKFPLTENGFTTFTAKMKKSDKFKRAKKAIDVKDAELDFSLDEIDSVKMVQLKVTTFDAEGESIPVQGEEVFVYVKRLYSLFTVDKGYTDKNGKYQVEFPRDMPGDSTGNVTVIVKLLESDNYGTIENMKEIQWGSVVSYQEMELQRTLWTGEAPLWMIIGVSIILLGAWFNFILAIYKVSKIKKAGEQTD